MCSTHHQANVTWIGWIVVPISEHCLDVFIFCDMNALKHSQIFFRKAAMILLTYYATLTVSLAEIVNP